jgi:hypothetical protein
MKEVNLYLASKVNGEMLYFDFSCEKCTVAAHCSQPIALVLVQFILLISYLTLHLLLGFLVLLLSCGLHHCEPHPIGITAQTNTYVCHGKVNHRGVLSGLWNTDLGRVTTNFS